MFQKRKCCKPRHPPHFQNIINKNTLHTIMQKEESRKVIGTVATTYKLQGSDSVWTMDAGSVCIEKAKLLLVPESDLQDTKKRAWTDDRDDTQNPKKRIRTELVTYQKEPVPTPIEKSVEDWLTCSVCTGLFVDPYTITECNHCYCRECLSTWINKGSRSCPICRTAIVKYPTPNALVGNMTRQFAEDVIPQQLKYLDTDSCELSNMRSDFIRRQTQLDEEDSERFQDLVDNISVTRSQGKPILSILDTWTAAEKAIISKGLLRYTGSSRQLYLSIIGFDRTFIDRASLEELECACSNLLLSPTPAKTRRKTKDKMTPSCQALRVILGAFLMQSGYFVLGE